MGRLGPCWEGQFMCCMGGLHRVGAEDPPLLSSPLHPQLPHNTSYTYPHTPHASIVTHTLTHIPSNPPSAVLTSPIVPSYQTG